MDYKNACVVSVYLSRVDKGYHVAIDAAKQDLRDFGITIETFIKLRDELEQTIRKVLGRETQKENNVTRINLHP